MVARPYEQQQMVDETTAAAAAGFPVVSSLQEAPDNSLLLPRFYPFYPYLQEEAESRNCHLMNTLEQHQFVSDIRAWHPVLGALTPTTWDTVDEAVNSGCEGPFFLKGVDKSLKYDFMNLCYAETVDDLIVKHQEVQNRMMDGKPVVVRKFLPLKSYGTVRSMGDAPISHEFRTFVFRNQIISEGFYWNHHADNIPYEAYTVTPPVALLEETIRRVGNKVTYYSVDTALTANNEWVVVEINDGCLSGLSTINPETHYRALAAAL